MKKKIFLHDYCGHAFPIHLSRNLAKAGYNVIHTFSGSFQTPKGDIKKHITDSENFNIYPIEIDGEFSKYSFLKRFFQERKYAQILLKKIKIEKPDIILSSQTPLLVQKVIIRYALKNKIKFVFWVQDLLGIGIKKILIQKNKLLGRIIGDYFVKLERTLLLKSNEVIVIAEEFLDTLNSFGINLNRVHVIQNWAPIDEMHFGDKRNDWAIKHKLVDKKVLLYSGTLGLKHNPDIILQIAKEFRNNKKFVVIIISEGLGVEWLKKQKNIQSLDNIIFFDFLNYDEFPLALSASDILLGILEKDAGIFSVPSKVLSYLCAGKPILLSVPENNLVVKIIKESGAGFASDPDNFEELILNLKKLLDDEQLCKKMGINGRNYAEREFDITTIVKKFSTILG